MVLLSWSYFDPRDSLRGLMELGQSQTYIMSVPYPSSKPFLVLKSSLLFSPLPGRRENVPEKGRREREYKKRK